MLKKIKKKKVLLGHKTAVTVSDNLPYDLIVLHLSSSSKLQYEIML
jgi:hypothetical protein